MNVLTVATLKGGNAKTTTCLALAAALAEKGHSIALVDADPQATATMIFGLRPVAEPWLAEPVELRLDGLRAGSITLVRGGRTLRLADAMTNEPANCREVELEMSCAFCSAHILVGLVELRSGRLFCGVCERTSDANIAELRTFAANLSATLAALEMAGVSRT